MTELADTLVRVENLSFRNAHEIVAETVISAMKEGKTGNEITKRMLEEAAMRVIGRVLTLSEEEIRSTLDPVESVRKRSVKGGPSPSEVNRMITDRFARISAEQEKLIQRRSRIKRAYDELTKIMEAIT